MKWLAPLVAAGSVLTAAAASAGLLPTNVSVTPESGKFRWAYAIVLPTDSQLKTGDYFTIYDFAGYVAESGTAPMANWTMTVQNVGPTPPNVLPTDDPTKPNLSWQYTGETIDVGQIGLGNFMAVSLYEDRTDSFFTARTHRTTDGMVDTNITSTEVPVPGGGPPEVPEPATLALAALGLPLLGQGKLRRKKAG
jgi:hypothetical protein